MYRLHKHSTLVKPYPDLHRPVLINFTRFFNTPVHPVFSFFPFLSHIFYYPPSWMCSFYHWTDSGLLTSTS